MRFKLVAASTITLTILSGFVFTLFAVSGFLSDAYGAAVMIGLTIAFNFVMWLVSPFFMDLIQSWVYKSNVITLADLGQRRPRIAEFVGDLCRRHGIRVPTLRLVHDMNPTAFCYGSTRNRARLVVSEGLLHYLDDEEAKAVYAHELGHIVHRDFIVMTVASTLVQILFEMYVVFRRMRGRRNPGPILALGAYIFYFIGTYLLLYLSRTRESFADDFSAQETRNPNALSMALVKIAYGIAEQPATEQGKRLLQSTRALGIYDHKAANQVGYAMQSTNAAGASAGAVSVDGRAVPAGFGTAAAAVTVPAVRRIEKVFLFDLFNPWAKVAELGSTHPLTGRRIQALCKEAQALHQEPLFSFARVDAQGRDLDKGRLYGAFVFELLLYFLPWIAAIGLGVAGIFYWPLWAALPLGVGFAMVLRGLYRYPSIGAAQPTTVLDLMSDPYASPMRGKPVILRGRLIGKAAAGSRIGEDFTMQDDGGGLITINYESPIPLLGNLFFGAGKANRLIGKRVETLGWFRRSVFHLIDLKRMTVEDGSRVNSYTHFWQVMGGFVLVVIGAVIAAMGGWSALTQAQSQNPLSTSTTGTPDTPGVYAPSGSASGGAAIDASGKPANPVRGGK